MSTQIERAADAATTFPSAAVIAASVAILIFVATKSYEFVSALLKEKVEQEKFITALYAEIDFNTADMETFLAESASVEAVLEKVKSDHTFIPHVIDSRHTNIYNENIQNINYIGKELIGEVITFYGFLEKLRSQVDGIYLPSFAKISAAGRAGTVQDIVTTAAECALAGRKLLANINEKYKDYDLKRIKRIEIPPPPTKAELDRRLKELTSDLDRFDAAHSKSPKS